MAATTRTSTRTSNIQVWDPTLTFTQPTTAPLTAHLCPLVPLPTATAICAPSLLTMTPSSSLVTPMLVMMGDPALWMCRPASSGNGRRSMSGHRVTKATTPTIVRNMQTRHHPSGGRRTMHTVPLTSTTARCSTRIPHRVLLSPTRVHPMLARTKVPVATIHPITAHLTPTLVLWRRTVPSRHRK